MSILNESGMKEIDVDLVKYFFKAKRFLLEELEDHTSGMFSTQQKLKELEGQLLNFILSYKNTNSIFFLFVSKEKEQNLKIVVSTIHGDPDELTKRFAIVLDEDLTGFKIKQLSLSSKVLTLIEEHA